MPYKKTYKKSFKKRPYRSPYTLNNAARAVSLAGQALMVANGVKNLINTEFKFNDVSSTTNVTTTAQIIDLTEIAEGTNNTERVGKSIRLKSLLQRGSARIDASASASALRAIIVHDMDNTGTAPSVTDILQSSSFVANINLASSLGRWRVLMDKTLNMSANGTQRVSWKRYIKLNHHVKYSGSAANSNQKGSLFLVLLSNESTNGVNININTRVRFIDN